MLYSFSANISVKSKLLSTLFSTIAIIDALSIILQLLREELEEAS